MKKILLLIGIMLALTSFTSAYSMFIENPSNDYWDKGFEYKERFTKTTYYPRSNTVITTTKYRDYDNEDRFSTYDYRYGYTYRVTEEYFEDLPNKRRSVSRSRKEATKSDSYMRYIPYLKKYEEVKCYNSPPKGKLFYTKCP